MNEDHQGRVRHSAENSSRTGFAADATEAAQLEAKASRMHSHTRLRGRYFLAPVMADSAMGVMLSLFVGECQGVRVGVATLAAANLLSRDETEALVDSLVQAGLATISGPDPEGRSVGLTPIGSARMRSHIGDYPDV